MEIITTWNILRTIHNFKCSYVLKKMMFIKFFLAGVSHDCFKLMCAYLNEKDKVCECSS